MNTTITTIYCITDDFLKHCQHSQSSQARLNDAEIITIALTAARFFGANFETAMTFLVEHHYIKHRLSRGRFNLRVHRLAFVFEALFDLLAQIWSETDADFIVDSFPVAVCDNIRIPRSRIYPLEATGGAFRGYCASKRRFFYGVKTHLMVTSTGHPVECFLTPGHASDTAQLKQYRFGLPEGSTVYGDKAYNEYETEDRLMECDAIKLVPIRKKGSRRAVDACMAYVQHRIRKQVETSISVLEQMFPKSIHAVTARGFELKVFLFILAYSFDGLC